MPDPETISYYQTHAADLALRYMEGGPALEGFFRSGSRVLDIGCGSGRDVCRLLDMGIDARGCDLSSFMLDQAAQSLSKVGHHPEERLRIAGLPDLSPYPEAFFDGLLCSAVLMHLPREQHFDAMWRMHRLLKPGGHLHISFSLFRPGVNPVNSRDAEGRLFLNIDPDELTLLCERIGYQHLDRQNIEDALGREGIRWCTLRFRRQDEGYSHRRFDDAENSAVN